MTAVVFSERERGFPALLDAVTELGRFRDASYKKLCQLLDGQWIEYRPDTDLVINPFELVRDIKEDMGFLLLCSTSPVK